MSEIIKRYKLIKQTPYNGWVEDDGTPMQIGRVIFSDEILSSKPFSFWVEGQEQYWEEIKEEQTLKEGDKYKCTKMIAYFVKDEIYTVVKGKVNYILSNCGNVSVNPSNYKDFYNHFEKVKVESKTALRYNEGKPEYSLIDLPSLEPCAKVLAFGAKKYSRNNWKKGFPISSILNSMLRHIAALQNGEEIDPESGLSHIGHIQCNALFLGGKNNTNDLKDEIEQCCGDWDDKGKCKCNT